MGVRRTGEGDGLRGSGDGDKLWGDKFGEGERLKTECRTSASFVHFVFLFITHHHQHLPASRQATGSSSPIDSVYGN